MTLRYRNIDSAARKLGVASLEDVTSPHIVRRHKHIIKYSRRVKDPSIINVNEPRWLQELGMNESDLRALVDRVGPSAAAVRQDLQSRRRIE